jgi:ABC-2 type transport system permease protein
MLVKESLQLLREPRMRFVVFGVPLIQMLVIAFALTTDVTRIETAVLDRDRTPAARELLADFTASGYFEITAWPESPAEIDRLLDHGRVQLVLQIPAGFQQELNAGRTANVQLLADGTDTNSTAIALGYANQIAAEYSRRKLSERAALLMGRSPPAAFELQARAWFNPNLESKNYFVPGLVAVMLIVIGMILTSVAIVREKEMGTIEQVMVTPLSSLEYILGKTIPYALISYINMTLMLLLAMAVFGIRVQGSWLLLYALTGIYILGNLGLALLISVTAQSQQQAVLTAFLFMMPCVLLSGFMFPIHNMPEAVQYATYLNPVRWYIEILRGVVIKGVGVGVLWRAILGQSLLAGAFILLAAWRFRKTAA